MIFEGTIRWISTIKDYGFIRPNKNNIKKDIFFKINKVFSSLDQRQIYKGQKVTYKIKSDQGDISAIHIQL